jgi:allantoinase
MHLRERFEYSAIVDRPPLRLPDGARVVVSTVVNVKNWNFDAAIPRQVMTTPAGVKALSDVPNWAWHEYGMRVGFWRLKEAFDGDLLVVRRRPDNQDIQLQQPVFAEIAGAARSQVFIAAGLSRLRRRPLFNRRHYSDPEARRCAPRRRR